jgi:hypothetical protein
MHMSENILDLPAIDESLIDSPPIPSTKVAMATLSMPDLAKVDLTDVALAQFGPWREKVAAASANISTLALDLSNQARIDDAKSLRHRLIGQPRADIRKTSKELKSKLAGVSKAIGEVERVAVLAYDEAEKPLTEQIEVAQKKLDDAKEAARLAEEARLQALREKVDHLLAKWLDRCNSEGITAARITLGIEAIQIVSMPADVADVSAYWDTAKASTVAEMGRLRDALQRREDDARIEAQRLENERIAAELAEQRRLLADEQEATRKQAEAQAAEAENLSRQREAARLHALFPQMPGAVEDTTPPFDDPKRNTGERADSRASPVASVPPSPRPLPFRPAEPAAAPSPATLKMGVICDRLCMNVTSSFLAELGISHSATERSSKLYRESDWPRICDALIAHITAARQQHGA